MKKSYDLIQVQPNDDSIDSEADLLLLFHPKNMSETLMFAVDQYLLGGGNLMVFADPLSLMDDPRMGGGGSIPEKLFKTWGISMEKGQGRCRLYLRHPPEKSRKSGGGKPPVAFRSGRCI